MSDDDKNLKPSSDELKKKIIGSIKKPYTGEQTSRWISNLNDDVLESDMLTKSGNSGLNLNSLELMDRMFDDFQRYVFEFSRSPQGRGFILNCSRPTTDVPAPLHGQPVVVCQGHLSTAHCALVILGLHGKIQGYMVPVDFVVGSRNIPSQFQPFVQLRAMAKKDLIKWTIDGHDITAEILPTVTKRFFGALIKLERGEAKPSDKFIFDSSDQPPAQPVVPERFKGDKVELMSDFAPAKSDYPPVQPTPPQVTQQPQYAQPDYQQQQQYAQNYLQQQPPPMPAQPPPPPPQPEYSSMAEVETVSRAFDRNKVVILTALDELIAKIDHELDTLTKIGMKTISVQDLAGAQRTINRSTKLKELRQRVNDLTNEWKSDTSD